MRGKTSFKLNTMRLKEGFVKRVMKRWKSYEFRGCPSYG
jgi:hypothetical protein